ncbi:MAG: lysophospholipid acyltransferase family protein [Solirubrobacterales bacterium]
MTRLLLEARAAAVVSRVLAALPRRAALALGRGLGALWGDIDRRHVAIAADHLRRAFPHWDESAVLSTARGVYRHFGQVLFDILWLQGRPRETVLPLVEIVGREHVDAAIAAGRGVVYATCHLSNWEVLALAHSWVFGPVSVVVRALDNPALDARLAAFRRQGGSTLIYKQHALGHALRRLREGGGVALLMDQNVAPGDGIFVPFFGRPAATTTVAAALAVKTGAALVPGHIETLPDGRYRSVYEAPLAFDLSANRAEELARLTGELTARIEGWVRAHPEQWLWLHRRWKTQPAVGEPQPVVGVEHEAAGRG